MYYYEEHILLNKHGDICTLDNSLVMEICSQNEKCFFNLYLLFSRPES